MDAQEPLFFEDELDALRDAVRALGGNKTVGAMLWPEIAADAAGRKLADMLNPNRSERLTLAQVMLIVRHAHAAGCHTPWCWISREVGYKAEPIAPEDEMTRLLRQNAQLLQRVLASQERIKQLEKLEATPENVRRIA